MPEIQVLAAVEPFSMDEVPALRVIVREREQTNPNIDYTKHVFVAFAGRFYRFTYFHLIHTSTDCDAPLFSEEAVYEYLVSTVEFDP
jgi:hypothetical protein